MIMIIWEFRRLCDKDKLATASLKLSLDSD